MTIKPVVCIAVLLAGGLSYRTDGLQGLLLMMPLVGVAVSQLLIMGFSLIPRAAKAYRYHGFEGQYYLFEGEQIIVHEDPGNFRWVEIPSARRAVGVLVSDAQLARQYPDAFWQPDPKAPALLRAEALLEHLRHRTQPRVIRFKLWLERTVVLPAHQKRELGRGRVQFDQTAGWVSGRDAPGGTQPARSGLQDPSVG